MRTSTQIFSVIVVTALFTVGCAGGPPMVPAGAQSKHFEAVSSHLELGGDVYVYADITQETENLAQLLNNLLKEARKTDTDIPMPEIDFAELFTTLGIDNIDAVGLSSYKRGDGFHNKAFIYIEGERRGMMKLFGGQTRPFHVTAMAPQDSDIVFDGDVNLKSLYDLFVTLFERYGGQEKDAILGNLGMPLSPLQHSIDDILSQMDTRMFGVMRVHDSKTIQIPDADVAVPFVDFVIGIDQLGFLADGIGALAHDIPLIRHEIQQNLSIVEPGIPMWGPLEGYAPVIVGDKESNQFFLASSMDYFRECRTTAESITASKEFEEAMFGLPQTGNSLGYASTHFKAMVAKTVASLSTHQDEMVRMSGSAMELIAPKEGGPEGSVSQNKVNGVYTAANSSSSHKSTLLTVAFANPIVLGTLAAIAIPAFSNYLAETKTEEAKMMLSRCEMGTLMYYQEHRKLPPSVDWTPAAPPSEAKYPLDPRFWNEPPWTDLEFFPDGDHYYQYRFVVEGNRVMCQAQGDLDGDGELSLYESSGDITRDGLVFSGSISEHNPHE